MSENNNEEMNPGADAYDANSIKLLKGLDAIGETLQVAGEIADYEARRALDQPWLEPA